MLKFKNLRIYFIVKVVVYFEYIMCIKILKKCVLFLISNYCVSSVYFFMVNKNVLVCDEEKDCMFFLKSLCE